MESPVQCGRNAHAAPGLFSLAGTAVKASGTDAQPDAAGSVLWGLGSFPNKQKIAFVSDVYKRQWLGSLTCMVWLM